MNDKEIKIPMISTGDDLDPLWFVDLERAPESKFRNTDERSRRRGLRGRGLIRDLDEYRSLRSLGQKLESPEATQPSTSPSKT